VNIVIYDVLGREVKTLINEFRQAGYHTVMFDASGFASGVYFYRITAKNNNKDFTGIKKMLLIK
jgi:Secretion system C-terminal sorting domain